LWKGCRGMIDELLKRIERLEYHQQLLIQLVDHTKKTFTKLIIQKNLGPEEVEEFHRLCEYLNKKMKEQKAEGFLYFHPLLKEFSEKVNKKLDVHETIECCLNEGLHLELMREFIKYLED
jgi:hypothetical protein